MQVQNLAAMNENFNNPAFADNELGDRAVSRRKLKPTFGTQASALMKKNLVFQKRNWYERFPNCVHSSESLLGCAGTR